MKVGVQYSLMEHRRTISSELGRINETLPRKYFALVNGNKVLLSRITIQGHNLQTSPTSDFHAFRALYHFISEKHSETKKKIFFFENLSFYLMNRKLVFFAWLH